MAAGRPPRFGAPHDGRGGVKATASVAAAYGTTFPLPDGAVVRRMNDKETAGEAGDGRGASVG
jgi:hypothetical protein